MKKFLRNNLTSLFSEKGFVTFVCFFVGISSVFGAEISTTSHSNSIKTVSSSSESAKAAVDEYFDFTSICDTEEKEEKENENVEDDLDEEITDHLNKIFTATQQIKGKKLFNWLSSCWANCNLLKIDSQSLQVPIYIRNCSMKIPS